MTMIKLPIKINGTPNDSAAVKADRPKLSRELATVLARRGTLGRIAALVVNECLVQVAFHADEKLYYISPLPSSGVQNERFILSGSSPYLPQRLGSNGNVIVPALMHESDIELGTASFQQFLPESSSWIDVDDSVNADKFVNVLRHWTGWDEKLTSVFEDRIRCSAQYLADTYVENRPAPTRKSDYITWEQSIVEANGHPLHKCRMPVDPRTQPTSGFNFKTADIAYFAVKREILDIHGPLEAELQPLLNLAGIDATSIDASEIVIPVHEFQVQFLLSLPQAAGVLRLLPEKVNSLAQSSTRSMTVPALPGLSIKLSLSLIIGDNIRTISSRSAYNAVRYWTAGMLDPAKVIGLQATPLEILPETACANALGDHLAVMIRWDPYHSSRPPVDEDVGYAVTGALCEPAFIGRKGCVAECVFQLNSLTERLEFLRRYTQLYFQCFLRPLFTNGLLIDAHGQNSILRFSRLTGQLLGFSARDMSGTRFNRAHFERTTGIAVEERMLNHDLSVVDLLERAYFIFFVVHLGPLMIALDVHREKSSANTLSTRGDGFTVVTRELHDAISTYENLQGEDAVSVTARELASGARKIWINAETWPLQCFISQRMRADWAHRDKSDKASYVPVPNIITS